MSFLGGLFGRKKPGALGIDEEDNPFLDEWTKHLPGMGGWEPQRQDMPPAQPPEAPSWLDGGKFRARDGIGLALGAIGDAISQQNGGQAITAPMLMKSLDASRAAARAAQRRQELVKAGVNPLLTDDDVAVREALAPKPIQPPAFVKNLDAWNRMSPAEKAEVAQMQSVLNPGFVTGADGQRYQNPPAQTFDPEEWEPYDPNEGGGAGNGASNFPYGNPLDPNLGRRRR